MTGSATDKDKSIAGAYTDGWSRKDLASIFKTTEWHVQKITKALTDSERSIHRDANRVRNQRIRNAAKAERDAKGGNLSKIRKELHKQSLEGAKQHYGTRKKHYKSKITTLTAYISELEDYDI